MNQKKFSNTAILIVAAILILGIGGYFFVTKKSEIQPMPSVNYQNNQPQNNNRTGNQTEEWKTYQNKDHGFEIKYPPQWRFITIGRNMNGESFELNPGNNPISTIGLMINSISSRNSANDYNITEQDLTNEVNQFKETVSNFKKETILIDGKSATKVSGLENGKEVVEKYIGMKAVAIFFIKNGELYSISYTGINGDYENEFNKILASLKFAK